MAYDPKPVDNSGIELSKELEPLIEWLAENNHELWAKGRVAEGWKLGPRRDESLLETPQLIPYDRLDESEKAYDRKMAVETLKSILRFGGKITAPHITNADARDEALTRWTPGRVPPGPYEEYRDLGKRANESGYWTLAFDIADEGLTMWKDDPALLQIKALAVARTGSAEQAKSLLASLGSIEDEETAGIIARVFKDRWLRTGEMADMRQARDSYRKAYDSHPERYWSGINAATLSWALGDAEMAIGLAGEISAKCEQLLKAPDADTYWLRATIAEAALIAAASADSTGADRVWRNVENLYAKARAAAGSNFGNIYSTWRNARIILQSLSAVVRERLEKAFEVPRVAVFAGHRIDKPGRAKPRFPPEIAAQVKKAIKDELKRLHVRIGFSTAASGSDILFLEALHELGGKTHIVMPCDEEQFVELSVADAGEEWVARYRAAMGNAEEVIVASEEKVVMGGLSFRYAADVLDGLATMRARQYETEPHHVAVWNELPGDGAGGTYDAVRGWRSRGGGNVCIINPLELAGGAHAPAVGGAETEEPEVPKAGIDPEMRAMIFADVKHFSKLTEAQVPVFLRGFIRPLAAHASRLNPKPEFQNTWGDGFFFVFRQVADAARFAVRLRDAVADIDRAGIGLPADMNLRIALHAGPVFRFEDQFIGRQNFIGSHVNRAARIEPVTVPGRIFATEAFAALATLQAPGQFRFDYVGKVPLAKDFGRFALYDVSLD